MHPPLAPAVMPRMEPPPAVETATQFVPLDRLTPRLAGEPAGQVRLDAVQQSDSVTPALAQPRVPDAPPAVRGDHAQGPAALPPTAPATPAREDAKLTVVPPRREAPVAMPPLLPAVPTAPIREAVGPVPAPRIEIGTVEIRLPPAERPVRPAAQVRPRGSLGGLRYPFGLRQG